MPVLLYLKRIGACDPLKELKDKPCIVQESARLNDAIEALSGENKSRSRRLNAKRALWDSAKTTAKAVKRHAPVHRFINQALRISSGLFSVASDISFNPEEMV